MEIILELGPYCILSKDFRSKITSNLLEILFLMENSIIRSLNYIATALLEAVEKYSDGKEFVEIVEEEERGCLNRESSNHYVITGKLNQIIDNFIKPNKCIQKRIAIPDEEPRYGRPSE